MPKAKKPKVKKAKAQKGISTTVLLILIPIILIVLILVGVFLVNLVSYFNTGKPAFGTANTTNTSPEASLSDFDKTDFDAYTVYYPKGYLKKNPPSDMTNIQLYFENPNTKAVAPEAIFTYSDNNEAIKAFKAPTYDLCARLSESYRKKSDDDIKAEVVTGGFGERKGVGCKTTVKSPIGEGINDAAVLVIKVLWNVGESDVYYAKALYFANASSDQAHALNLAIDQFTLK